MGKRVNTQNNEDSPTVSPLSANNDALLSLIPKDELVKLAVRLNKYLEKENLLSDEFIEELSREAAVPVSIFSKRLSPLEALVKFLKEEKKMTYHKIGEKIGRDERGIWVTYRNAKKKMDNSFEFSDEDVFVPMKIFVKELSILESLVKYLREDRELKGKDMASLLGKSSSTVWTAYNRAKEKVNNGDE